MRHAVYPPGGWDYQADQVVVGSGFGGAASALRLSEKGYSVLLLEQGRRWRDQDFPRSNWALWKVFWVPWLGLTGPNWLSFTRKVMAVHGCGVGGGSLIYANTHLIPEAAVFDSPPWRRIRPDWQTALAPYYALAQRMLGVAVSRYQNLADHTLREVAREMGREHTFRTVNSGILFPGASERPGQAVDDPYFAGDGPPRATCRFCGGCMVGCRHNAKNTLVKNYLHFAERNGVEIRAESRVVAIAPLPDEQGNRDGGAGYELTVERGVGWHRQRYRLRCRGVVLAGGVFGTVPLLLRMRDITGSLPDLSRQLGQRVRTNSETLLALGSRLRDAAGKLREVWEGTAITSVFAPDEETHVEIVRYPRGADVSFAVTPAVPLTEGGGSLPRGLRLLLTLVRHPWRSLKLLNPVGKTRSFVYLLVMQSRESFIHLEMRRPWYRLFRPAPVAVQKPDDEPLSTYFPIAHEVARRYVARTGGEAANLLTEVVADMPVTAHIMGGVPMGASSEEGVVNQYGEVFGYHNLRVLDGSVIPGNLGVNPSLTILALTEHAMAHVPVGEPARAARIRPVRFSPPRADSVSAFTGEGALSPVRWRGRASAKFPAFPGAPATLWKKP